MYIIGAGPGAPDLISLRGFRCLQKADVVIFDHLVHPDLLEAAPRHAERIDVGSAAPEDRDQDAISYLIAEKAREGKVVARLKWGDPFLFDQGGEEALFLHEQGVPYEVVPGVPHAIGASAYAGIPITHRGLSAAVTFITGHEDPTKPQSSLHWQHLAHASDTLVIFMGVSNIKHIAAKLLLHGKPPEMPVAFIQQGTYEQQITHTCTLLEISELLATADIRPPAIIVIGKVVRLREKLQWFEAQSQQQRFPSTFDEDYVFVS